MERFNAIAADLKEKRLAYKKDLENAFTAGLKCIFDDCPEIQVISCSGYTPYFNDGEPCEHSHGFLVNCQSGASEWEKTVDENGKTKYVEVDSPLSKLDPDDLWDLHCDDGDDVIPGKIEEITGIAVANLPRLPKVMVKEIIHNLDSEFDQVIRDLYNTNFRVIWCRKGEEIVSESFDYSVHD